MKNVILLEEDEFKGLLNKVDAILNAVTNEQQVASNTNQWLDTHEACKFLNVTSRSMLSYRVQNLVPWSQFGGKIKYNKADLENLLTKNYVKAKKP